MRAAFDGHVDMVTMLVRAGADKEMRNAVSLDGI